MVNLLLGVGLLVLFIAVSVYGVYGLFVIAPRDTMGGMREAIDTVTEGERRLLESERRAYSDSSDDIYVHSSIALRCPVCEGLYPENERIHRDCPGGIVVRILPSVREIQ